MQPQPVTSKQYFATLKIIHFALIAGVVMFSLVSFLINRSATEHSSPLSSDQNILFIIIGATALGGIFIGDMISRKNIETAKNEKQLIQKMTPIHHCKNY